MAAGFGEGFLSNLGRGFQTAGAILSPAVYEQQSKERMQEREAQLRQQAAIQQIIARAVESGSMPPEAASAFGLSGLRASPQAQMEKDSRQALAGSGGDINKALETLISTGNIKGAHDLAPLLKIQQERELNKEFGSALQGSGTAEALDAMAARMAASGHPGAATLTTTADKRRMAAEDRAAMPALRSQMMSDAPAATEEDAVARINAGGGGPMSIGIGENPNIIPRQEGGLFSPYFNHPNPGIAQRARFLQSTLDKAPDKGSDKWIAAANALSTQAAQFGQQQQMSQFTVDNRRDPVPQKDAWQQVTGPDGKGMFVRGSELDPNVHTPYSASSSSGTSTAKGDFSKQGEEFLASLPVEDRSLVKKIADYEIDSKTMSLRGGHRERVLSMVSQYRPEYDETQYANKRRAIANFGSGPQGNTVRSLNVAVEHIDTLNRAAEALKNGEFTPGNKLWNEVAKIAGKTPPNTFEGIRDIVANEVVKGTIGGISALDDRRVAAAKVKASASPQQLAELTNGWTELMGGQAIGLERQYQGSTGMKDFRGRYLTPRTIEAIRVAESKAVGNSVGVSPGAESTSPGFSDEKERRYQELLRRRNGNK